MRHLLLVLLVACGGSGEPDKDADDTDVGVDDTVDTVDTVDTIDTPNPAAEDADQDGFPADEDCDDTDASVSPAAAEVPYDGVDQDCAGGDLVDVDVDGAPFPADCDDGEAAVGPAMSELCNGVDDDCDGEIDLDPTDGVVRWVDVDVDSWGGLEAYVCASAAGYVDRGGDCDDAVGTVFPGASELPYDGVDQDCAGGDLTDVDQDGAVWPVDCDDGAAAVRPGQPELCNGVDDDCSGVADDRPVDGLEAYADADGDGFGDGPQLAVCALADLQAAVAGDCDDADAGVFPGQIELPYDGVDQDCNGSDPIDLDGDRDPAVAAGGGDCDDLDPGRSSLADEVCDGVDQDCDTVIDDDPIDATQFYADGDGDGFGDAVVFACAQGDHALVAGDCDDAAPSVHPGAAPIACSGVAEDCGAEEPGGGAILGGQVYPLVQALSFAVEGDEITVCEGRHHVVGLEARVGLTLVGLAGAEGTVLDGDDLGGILAVRTTSPVVLRNLTLTEGAGHPVGGDNFGGAVWTVAGADLTLDGCVLRGNRAGHGGAIDAGDGASLTLSSCVLEENLGDDRLTVVGDAGGVRVGRNGALVLSATQIARNDAGTCGGVRVGVGASLIGADGSVISGNAAALVGGGVCAGAGSRVEGVTVSRNSAATGAGLDGEEVSLVDVSLLNNHAGLTGGGAHFFGASTLLRVTLVDNISDIEAGGVDAFGGELVLDSCLVDGNRATFFAALAGGVRMDGDVVTSVNTDWGTRNNNGPGDLGLVRDARTIPLTGVLSFSCTDGLGAACP